MSTKPLLTADDLARMPEPDDNDVRMELDEGELITMPPAGEEHGFCGHNIDVLLGIHVKKYKLGRVYTCDTGLRLTNLTVRAPDVAFVRKERSVSRRSVKAFSPTVPRISRSRSFPLRTACARS
jgi:Uma2 family endonuclease